MAAPKKYGDELRERATRMAVEARQNPETKAGAIKRTCCTASGRPTAHP